MLAAVFVVLSPFVTRRWRSLGIGTFVVVVVLRLVTSVDLPRDAVPLARAGRDGRRAGPLPLRPARRTSDRRRGPRGAAIRRARRRGSSTPRMWTLGDRRRTSGPSPTARDCSRRCSAPRSGRPTSCSACTDTSVPQPGRRTAVLLVAAERRARGVRRAAARDVGILTPRHAGGRYRRRRLLPARVRPHRRARSSISSTATASTTRSCNTHWQQVALLRKHRIAHRDLRLANVVVDDANQPWIIDFGFAEVAASDALLDADIAQVSQLAVGARRRRATVDAGIAVLGPEPFAAALPRLQMGALSGATQTALRHHPACSQLQQRSRRAPASPR